MKLLMMVALELEKLKEEMLSTSWSASKALAASAAIPRVLSCLSFHRISQINISIHNIILPAYDI